MKLIQLGRKEILKMLNEQSANYGNLKLPIRNRFFILLNIEIFFWMEHEIVL